MMTSWIRTLVEDLAGFFQASQKIEDPAALEYVNRHIEELAQAWVRRILLVAVLMWIFFVIPDVMLGEQIFKIVLPYRIGIVLFMSALIYINSLRRSFNYQFIVSLLGCGMSSLAIVLISGSYHEHHHVHYAAFILLFISGLGFFPFGRNRALAMIAAVYAPYIVIVPLFQPIIDKMTFILINCYVLASAVMLFFMRINQQHHLQSELLMMYRLENAIVARDSKLRHSTVMLETIINNADEGVVVLNDIGLIMECNRKFCELHGRTSPDDILGKDILTLYYMEAAEEVSRIIKVLKSATISKTAELRTTSNKNERLFVEVNMASLNIEGYAYFIGFYRDITERKRLYQEISHSQKMESIGNLACGMSHDFKNILAIVLAYVDFIRNVTDNSTTDPVMSLIIENTLIMEKEVAQAKELVSNLLKIGRKEPEADFEVLAIDDVFRDEIVVFKQLLSRDGIVLEWNPGANGSEIFGSKSGLKQVLSNLILNAKDASKNGGAVTVETSVIDALPQIATLDQDDISHGQYAYIRVRDSGIGIDEKLLPYIFEPFFSTKNREVQSIGGIGLGLTMVYGIVKEHKGYISVDSVYGEGTSFHVYFPVWNYATDLCKGQLLGSTGEA